MTNSASTEASARATPADPKDPMQARLSSDFHSRSQGTPALVLPSGPVQRDGPRRLNALPTAALVYGNTERFRMNPPATQLPPCGEPLG